MYIHPSVPLCIFTKDFVNGTFITLITQEAVQMHTFALFHSGSIVITLWQFMLVKAAVSNLLHLTLLNDNTNLFFIFYSIHALIFKLIFNIKLSKYLSFCLDLDFFFFLNLKTLDTVYVTWRLFQLVDERLRCLSEHCFRHMSEITNLP